MIQCIILNIKPACQPKDSSILRQSPSLPATHTIGGEQKAEEGVRGGAEGEGLKRRAVSLKLRIPH